MTDSDKTELYSALVAVCQQYGFTTEATYEALNSAVNSIVADDPNGEDGEDNA